MKVNTDGVLLGALAQASKPSGILDIGTGTGVIAMMLAQRFSTPGIEAVETDMQAAETARQNFQVCRYSDRLALYPYSFQDFSKLYPCRKYDLVVSNPPFFTNSLKNPDNQKRIARHAEHSFFSELVAFIAGHLSISGRAYLIVPPAAATAIAGEAETLNLNVQHRIDISSYGSRSAHRQIIGLGFGDSIVKIEDFIIYETEKVYTEQYRKALKDFLTIF